MLEAVADWTGFTGGPGNTVMYFTETSPDVPTAMGTFFTGVAAHLPDDVTIAIPSEGRRIDPSDGSLLGTWSAPPHANVAGTGLGAYPAPSGAHVRWNTSGVAGNRFVRGRTFLVPLIGTSYGPDGTLDAGAITDIQAAADALVASANAGLVIWSRPLEDAAGAIIRAGTEHEVTSAAVPDKAAVLTSRRD